MAAQARGSRVSRRLSLVLAGVALVLAAALVTVAIEVRRSAAEMGHADARFERSSPKGWEDVGAHPLGLGRRLLGLGDDLAFRRATESFEDSRPSTLNPPGGLAGVRASRAAEKALEPFAGKDPDSKRKAAAANLLGIIAFESSRSNPQAATTLQSRSLDELRAALKANPDYSAAKFNLELALSLSGQGGIGNQGNGRGNQAATVGAVVSPTGHGY